MYMVYGVDNINITAYDYDSCNPLEVATYTTAVAVVSLSIVS